MAVQVNDLDLYENVDDDSSLGTPTWLHGKVGRNEVKQILHGAGLQDGSFLIRESTRAVGDYVLSMVHAAEVQHYIVSKATGAFRIDDGPPFKSLQDLVKYYGQTQDRLPSRLIKPIPNGNQSLSQSTANMSISQPQGQLGSGLAALVGGGGGAKSSTLPGRPATRAPVVSGGEMYAASDPAGPPVAAGGEMYAASDSISAPGNLPPRKNPAQDPLPPRPAGGRPAAAAPGGGTRPIRSYANPQPTPQAAVPKANTLPAKSNAPTNVRTNRHGVAIVANREGFEDLPQVKKWIDRGGSVDAIQLDDREEEARNLPEGFTKDRMETAQQREDTFRKAALAEEKMYLMWMNGHLKKIGKSIPDISDALKNGVAIMDVLSMIGKDIKPPPKYAAKPNIHKEADNWQRAIGYMKKLGIPVEENAPGDGTGLDPQTLHSLDRREILKLFSKLLLWETQLDDY